MQNNETQDYRGGIGTDVSGKGKIMVSWGRGKKQTHQKKKGGGGIIP